MRRDDVNELRSEIVDIRREDFTDSSPESVVMALADALDTARNCIENLGNELEELKARVKRLERDS